jgi:hypothetical protein
MVLVVRTLLQLDAVTLDLVNDSDFRAMLVDNLHALSDFKHRHYSPLDENNSDAR